MSKSRKWVASVLVAASMAVVGTASALDDALVSEMASAIESVVQQNATASEAQKIDAIKAALAGNDKFSGKLDELVQALSDAKVADAVATQVIMSSSPTMTLETATNNFAAAKIVTDTKSAAPGAPVNLVTAAGNQQQQQQQQQQPIVQQQTNSSPGQVFQAAGNGAGGASNSSTPSSAGAGTGVSRT